MAIDDDDNFLGRWSRRKHAARRGDAAPEPEREVPAARSPPPAPAAAVAPAPAAPAELPSLDSLKGLESDYREFLRPGVDPATRSAALTKLFSDPHFHFDRMDKLDTYIDDYTRSDPIPAAMLKVLSQARGLGLFDELEKAERPEAAAAATPQPGVAAIAPPVAPAPESAEGPEVAPVKTGGA